MWKNGQDVVVQRNDCGALCNLACEAVTNARIAEAGGVEGLAAALGDLWPALDPFPGVHIVGLVHDEILLEVPRVLVNQVREIAMASMTSQKLQKQYLGDIPLEADCNVAETWGEAH